MVKYLGFYLNGNKEVYRAGELVSGECVLELTEPLKAKAVRMYLHGQALVNWDESKTSMAHVGHYVVPKSKTETLVARKTYVNLVYTVWGIKVNETGQASQLPVGTHRWKYSMRLPEGPLPSSHEGEYGTIRYWLKSEIHKPFPWPNVKRYRCITVLDDLDMNGPDYQEPVRRINEKIVSKVLGIGNSGKIELHASTDKKGYCSGESIGILARMVNQSTKDMNGSKAELIQRTECYAEGKENIREHVISSIQGAKIPKDVTVTWTWETMKIKCVPPSSRPGSCSIVDVSYYIKMFIQVPLGFDLHVHLPIVIGTIPYRHRTGNVTPTAAQASLPIAQYDKCDTGLWDIDESASGFPNLKYTSMSAYVPKYTFVPPGQRPQPIPTVNKSASAPVKKATSVPPPVSSYFVVIRFPKDQLSTFQRTLQVNKSTVENHGGVLICVTDKISTTIGFPWSESHGMALMVFPNKDKAVDWVKTTPEVSETGWLGGADITVFPMIQINKPEILQGFYRIELTTIPRTITQEELNKMLMTYTRPLRTARSVHGASLLTSVGSKDYENVRGKLVTSPYIFTCIQFSSVGSYEKFMCLLQTGEFKVAMDFWAELYRLESRVTMETIDMKWWLEGSAVGNPVTKIDTAEAVLQKDEEMGVYMVIRFPFDKFSLFQDIVKQNKPLLRKTHGGMVALAAQVITIEGPTWPVDKAVAILKFKTSDDSKQWLEGVSRDEGFWLNECDIFIMKKSGHSHEGNRTFSMISFTRPPVVKRSDVAWITEKRNLIRGKYEILFTAGKSLKNCECIKGEWLTGKQFLTCTQWPNAKSFIDYQNEWKSEVDVNALDKVRTRLQNILFDSVDFSWLEESGDDGRDKPT